MRKLIYGNIDLNLFFKLTGAAVGDIRIERRLKSL